LIKNDQINISILGNITKHRLSYVM